MSDQLDTVSRIYCGRRIPGESESISDSDVDEFERQIVALHCPDGWTRMPAEGGWRDMGTGATIREPSVIFEIAHGAGGQRKVREIAEAWKNRFHQDAVMVASTPLSVQFV